MHAHTLLSLCVSIKPVSFVRWLPQEDIEGPCSVRVVFPAGNKGAGADGAPRYPEHSGEDEGADEEVHAEICRRGLHVSEQRRSSSGASILWVSWHSSVIIVHCS